MSSITKGISVCNFKIGQKTYRKVQIFWTSTDGIEKRTTLSLGNVRQVTDALENAVLKLCEDFRKSYKLAIKNRQEFDEEDEDLLKAAVDKVKRDFKAKAEELANA